MSEYYQDDDDNEDASPHPLDLAKRPDNPWGDAMKKMLQGFCDPDKEFQKKKKKPTVVGRSVSFSDQVTISDGNSTPQACSLNEARAARSRDAPVQHEQKHLPETVKGPQSTTHTTSNGSSSSGSVTNSSKRSIVIPEYNSDNDNDKSDTATNDCNGDGEAESSSRTKERDLLENGHATSTENTREPATCQTILFFQWLKWFLLLVLVVLGTCYLFEHKLDIAHARGVQLLRPLESLHSKLHDMVQRYETKQEAISVVTMDEHSDKLGTVIDEKEDDEEDDEKSTVAPQVPRSDASFPPVQKPLPAEGPAYHELPVSAPVNKPLPVEGRVYHQVEEEKEEDEL